VSRARRSGGKSVFINSGRVSNIAFSLSPAP
jgi:hypothetical protein